MSGGWAKDYNRAERLLWQDPRQIFSEIGLEPGQTLVDIGCGDGFFSIPAAKIVGRAGLVYALDADTEALAVLSAKIKATDITNIRPLLADATESLACVYGADTVLLANVLHDFRCPLKVLANIRQTLRPQGLLADLDWKKEPQQLHGPPVARRLNQEEATALIQQAGFKMIKSTTCGPFHYLLLAVPS